MTKVAICPKCGAHLTADNEHVSSGYDFACLKCDEDFYRVEVKDVLLEGTTYDDIVRCWLQGYILSDNDNSSTQ